MVIPELNQAFMDHLLLISVLRMMVILSKDHESSEEGNLSVIRKHGIHVHVINIFWLNRLQDTRNRVVFYYESRMVLIRRLLA